MKDGFEITAEEVKSYIKRGEKLFFVNVRHHQDWDLAVMKVLGALRVPDDEVGQHLDEIPRDHTTIVYSTCPGDAPSIRAARLLQQQGWDDVHPLIGGFKAYLMAGLPVEEIGEGSATKKVMLL